MNHTSRIKDYILKQGEYDGILEIPQEERIAFPMSKTCKVSIVIPVYNESSLVEKCLDSLKNQSVAPGNFEVIIVDNNSKDDTSKRVNSWLQKNNTKNIYLVSQKSPGVTAARKRGFDEAVLRYTERAEDIEYFVLSADADNEISSNWIETYLHDFLTKKVDLLCGESQFDTSKLSEYRNLLKFIEYKYSLENLIKNIYVGRAEGNNFGIKLEAYAAVGGFKQVYSYGEQSIYPIPTDDWRFSVEVIAKGYTYARSTAKVILNTRKFTNALNEILEGKLYLEGWQEHATNQINFQDLADEQLIELKQTQLQGILANQMLINIVASPNVLHGTASLKFLGEDLSKNIKATIAEATYYIGIDNFSMYRNYYLPAYFIYYSLGKDITSRLNLVYPNEKFTFILPKQLESIDSMHPGWKKNSFIVAHLFAPADVTCKYFGSMM